jgi:hypothetical protein
MATKRKHTIPVKRGQRMILFTADIVRLTGKHYNTALKMMQMVREAYGKKPSSMVTAPEFSEVFEIDIEIIFMCMD